MNTAGQNFKRLFRSLLQPTFWLMVVVALTGASLFAWWQTPLPWLLGPLLSVAVVRVAGVRMTCPVPIRSAGQWVIGVALGLYFTPAVFAQMGTLWWALLAGLVWAWIISLLFAAVLHRFGGLDPVSAFFAGAVGGASEMAIQSERHQAHVEVVVAIHSLRVLIVVVSLPFAYRLLDLHGADSSLVERINVVAPGGLVALMALTVGAALVFQRMRSPNAWMLGPLLVTIFLTANDWNLSALPEAVIKAGQVFIGMSLGSRFRPESMRRLRSIALLVIVASFGLILLSSGFAAVLASLLDIPWATMVLATSPGGIAEMSLTAKLLHLGVPVVTVFHVTRLAFILITVGPVFNWLAARYHWVMPGRSLPL